MLFNDTSAQVRQSSVLENITDEHLAVVNDNNLMYTERNVHMRSRMPSWKLMKYTSPNLNWESSVIDDH